MHIEGSVGFIAVEFVEAQLINPALTSDFATGGTLQRQYVSFYPEMDSKFWKESPRIILTFRDNEITPPDAYWRTNENTWGEAQATQTLCDSVYTAIEDNWQFLLQTMRHDDQPRTSYRYLFYQGEQAKERFEQLATANQKDAERESQPQKIQQEIEHLQAQLDKAATEEQRKKLENSIYARESMLKSAIARINEMQGTAAALMKKRERKAEEAYHALWRARDQIRLVENEFDLHVLMFRQALQTVGAALNTNRKTLVQAQQQTGALPNTLLKETPAVRYAVLGNSINNRSRIVLLTNLLMDVYDLASNLCDAAALALPVAYRNWIPDIPDIHIHPGMYNIPTTLSLDALPQAAKRGRHGEFDDANIESTSPLKQAKTEPESAAAAAAAAPSARPENMSSSAVFGKRKPISRAAYAALIQI